MTDSRPTISTGLTSAEAERRLAEYGPNEIARAASVTRLQVLLRQFSSLLIVILIAAAVIAAVLGEWIDAVAVTLVLILNGVLGYVQEWKAETAIARLREMLTLKSRVVRDGRHQLIDTHLLVPGDLVVLDSGDRVPADMTLTAAVQLKIDESILTGESVSVDKQPGPERGQLFMGTNVVAGRAEGTVTETGLRTQFGEIADLTGSVGPKVTQLQQELGRLARMLGLVALALGAAISLVGLSMGRPLLEMFMTGLALAVAMVPEGLPAVVTITLALGASAMLRQKALVRRLQAIETLGAASIICTDKTGTLTENEMTAQTIWTVDQRYEVTGSGYDPEGHIACESQRVRAAGDQVLAAILDVAITCTHADLSRVGDEWRMVGDPTEGALVTLAYKGWAPLPEHADTLAEIPFSSERKMMSVIARRNGELVQLTKGAPEQVLACCATVRSGDQPQPLKEESIAQIQRAQAAMAEDGLRVLAFAKRTVPGIAGDESDLEFLGLVGLIDPPRPEVRDAVSLCHSAGIRVMMITGDAAPTAAAVARTIGLPADRFLTGAELDALDDASLSNLLEGVVHFARTSPVHKMRIVECLQERGQIAAMTGDGVNDAPALKRADIGVAMGVRGTDVAKDASDLVLLDDNFATIVHAIEEGRRQFSNIQKFVRYLLASNAGEVLAIVVNLLLGGPLVFLATQILWMNLITDGATAVALGLEKSSPLQMSRPPRARNTPIVGPRGILMILCLGLYTGSTSLWLFYSYLPQGEELARTVAFTAMVVFEKISVFAFRSFSVSCTRLGWLSNRFLIAALLVTFGLQIAAVYTPALQVFLRTVPLDLEHWCQIGMLALPLLILPELAKWLFSRATLPAIPVRG